MTDPMATDPTTPSAQKKRRAPEEEKLSLEAIREVVRSEVTGSTSTLRAEINQRMDRVETGVTAQLERTLERLAAITNQQAEQQRVVETIQGEQYSMSARLQALENKVQVIQSTGASSTADTDFGGRKPALIMGGWGDDTPAEEQRETDGQRFAAGHPHRPSLRSGGEKGIRHTPLWRQRRGGSRDRLSAALRRFRQANIQMGVQQDGKAKYLWLQLSQSPERRRHVQLAGKCKRLCLTLGGDLAQSRDQVAGRRDEAWGEAAMHPWALRMQATTAKETWAPQYRGTRPRQYLKKEPPRRRSTGYRGQAEALLRSETEETLAAWMQVTGNEGDDLEAMALARTTSLSLATDGEMGRRGITPPPTPNVQIDEAEAAIQSLMAAYPLGMDRLGELRNLLDQAAEGVTALKHNSEPHVGENHDNEPYVTKDRTPRTQLIPFLEGEMQQQTAAALRELDAWTRSYWGSDVEFGVSQRRGGDHGGQGGQFLDLAYHRSGRRVDRLLREGTQRFHSHRRARNWGAVHRGEDYAERAEELLNNVLQATEGQQRVPDHFRDSLDRVVHLCQEASAAHAEAWGEPGEEQLNLDRAAEVTAPLPKKARLGREQHQADVVAHAGGQPSSPILGDQRPEPPLQALYMLRRLQPFLHGQMHEMVGSAICDLMQWSTQFFGAPVEVVPDESDDSTATAAVEPLPEPAPGADQGVPQQRALLHDRREPAQGVPAPMTTPEPDDDHAKPPEPGPGAPTLTTATGGPGVAPTQDEESATVPWHAPTPEYEPQLCAQPAGEESDWGTGALPLQPWEHPPEDELSATSRVSHRRRRLLAVMADD
ncbi:BBS7 [Symbiodinium sp. CCMP2592]|nr:BBS7 [Symbiodinium sp. CCMP2592]